MSAQALNGNSYKGYNAGLPSALNPSGAIPTRDASDITRQLKERLIYNGFKNGSTITPGGSNLMFQRPTLNPAGANHIPGNSEWSWLPYGNQFRLSYFFGKMNNCLGACAYTGTPQTITAISGSGTAVTVTVASNAGFGVGGTVVIANVTTTTAYNGTYTIASLIGTTQFTYLSGTTGTGGVSGTTTATVQMPGGLFNGNGPKLPGTSTSTGS